MICINGALCAWSLIQRNAVRGTLPKLVSRRVKAQRIVVLDDVNLCSQEVGWVALGHLFLSPTRGQKDVGDAEHPLKNPNHKARAFAPGHRVFSSTFRRK